MNNTILSLQIKSTALIAGNINSADFIYLYGERRDIACIFEQVDAKHRPVYS